MRLIHVFVDSFPEPLEQGNLYVSMRYASVAHLCACGCGHEVVTPIRKRGWRLAFDGEGITLSPSIGSHNLACRSHYFIRDNEIRWAGKLSQDDIHAGRIANRQGGLDFEQSKEALASPLIEPKKTTECSSPLNKRKTGLVGRVLDWWERQRVSMLKRLK